MRASPTRSVARTAPRGGILRLARRLRSRRGDVSAFTLVETAIALAILSIGILGVAAAMITALKFSRGSRSQTQAMYLAEQQMEIFHLMSGADVNAARADGSYPNDPANPIDPDPNDANVKTFDRSWTIQQNTPEAGVFTLTVIVGWTDELGSPRTLRLQRLKADL
jgi:Tfp pilus assembly protein PilV